MNILFSHANFPAQFRRLAPHLAARGHRVVFLCQQKEWHAPTMDGVQLVPYRPSRSSAPELIHPYLERVENPVLAGQAAFRAALALRDEQAFEADVIVSHAGFGSGLYLADAFPKARRIGLFEWYYTSTSGDVAFLYDGAVPDDRKLRLRTWNMPLLQELAQCDAAVVPTAFQRSQFPAQLQPLLTLLHEGVDVPLLSQLRRQPPPKPAWWPKDPNAEIVTYVSRGFELYRGFPQAMQALSLLQQQRPRCHVLIAGDDVVCYGGQCPHGMSWGAWARHKAGLDPQRTHWLGALQSDEYHALLGHTQAHLYLTIPFVLSWSLLEAMAAGCPIVASATEPVQEVMNHREEGLLAPLEQPAQIAAALDTCLRESKDATERGSRAMDRATAYSSDAGLEAWTELIESTPG